jgi:ABC-type transport system involved in multi-copper enzyme maturation permease subunit
MRAFVILAVEAFRDGLRRRLALVVAVALVLGIASAHSCTQLGSGDFSVNGRELDRHMVAGFLAPLLFAFQALTVLAIAGLVASDHLARPLAEGNAVLWLARPVSRHAWAGARLVGATAIALAAGLVLLGGTGTLLVLRQGVAVAPAFAAAGATALGALVVASLAMAASLSLGRSAVTLLVLIGLALVVIANGYSVALGIGIGAGAVSPDAAEFGGLLGAIDRYGPPLFSSIAAAVAAWNPHVETHGLLAATLMRLGVWAVAGVALLLATFARREIES